MDDFNKKFCRKRKQKSFHKFLLTSSIKKEFEKHEISTPIVTLSIEISPLSNETVTLNELFQNLLDEVLFSMRHDHHQNSLHHTFSFVSSSYE